MPRAQKPAQNESEGVVDDEALDLLEEILVLVLVMFRHLASPAMSRRHRWPLHDSGGGLATPGESHARLSTGRHPSLLSSRNLSKRHLGPVLEWTKLYLSSMRKITPRHYCKSQYFDPSNPQPDHRNVT